jgi:hypothetical protein
MEPGCVLPAAKNGSHAYESGEPCFIGCVSVENPDEALTIAAAALQPRRWDNAQF